MDDIDFHDQHFRNQIFYNVLGTRGLDALVSSPSMRVVNRHSVVHATGKIPDDIYVVASGWAFRYVLLPDGRRQILNFYLPGDFISPQAMLMRPLWFCVQALTEMKLISFERSKIYHAIIEDEALHQRFSALCAATFENMDRRLVWIGRRSAQERICSLLKALEGRFRQLGQIDEDGWFACPLSQEHIADALGLTRVHVSRVLGKLRAEGRIAIDEGKIALLDRRWLDRMAREPSLMRAKEDDVFAG